MLNQRFAFISEPLRRFRVLQPALVVLMLALSATLLAAWLLKENARRAGDMATLGEAVGLRDAVSDVMSVYEQSLRAGVGLIHASGHPNKETWQRFAASLSLDVNYPGLQGFGYARVTAKEAREPDRLTTQIEFLYPEDWRNMRAIGFDMFAEPVRRLAMQRAIDSGKASLSGTVTLVQETDEDTQPGALLYVPFYGVDFAPGTVEARRETIAGFVYGALRLSDFFTRAIAKHQPNALNKVRLEVFDGTVAGRKLFDSRTDKKVETETPRYSHVLDISVGGHPWALRVSSQPEFESVTEGGTTGIALAAGVVISLLLGAITSSLAWSREQMAVAGQRLSLEVAERRRAQEEVQLANGELIHRVKNTLAIVSAIASLTARHATSVPEFIGGFRDRLSSLARVQDLLRPDPAFSPDLKTLISDILAAYRTETSVATLVIDGPDIEIPRNEAVLFSLLINELATNASKYGAWSSPGGRVDVSWHIVAEGNGANGTRSKVVWAWVEQGGPLVKAPTQFGFGTHVLASIERGMGGAITTTYEPGGVAVKFVFPHVRGL